MNRYQEFFLILLSFVVVGIMGGAFLGSNINMYGPVLLHPVFVPIGALLGLVVGMVVYFYA